MEDYINGHNLSVHTGHYENTLVYVDCKLVSDGRKLRPDKGPEFWRKFLQGNPSFDALCVLPVDPPWNTKLTFEDLYT